MGFIPDSQSSSSGSGFTPDSSQTDTSNTQQVVQPELSTSDKLKSALSTTKDLILKGVAGAPEQGMLNAVAGGPVVNIADAIKKAALDTAIPSNDLVSSSFKNAVVQGTNPLNITMAMIPAGSIAEALKNKVNFGGDKALTKIAQDAKNSLTAAGEAFKQSYNTLFDKVGSKLIPSTSKDSLLLTASDALEQTAPNSLANKFLSETLPKTLDSEQLNLKELHAMKGHIFKQAKSSIGVEKNALMKVYDKINDVLSSKHLGGDKYAQLTSEQHQFFNNEANYVKRLILDPINKENVTNQNLRQFNLSDNFKEALNKLSSRATSKTNLLESYDAVRRGEILKGAIIKTAKLAATGTILGKSATLFFHQ